MLNNRSVPRATVIPELPYPDIEKAIAWLSDVFGFTLRLQIANHRAQINVGDGAVVLTDKIDRFGTTSVLVRVEDVDAVCQRAEARGARIAEHPVSFAYGERQCAVLDLAGHQWRFTQSIADVDPLDWGGTPGTL